MVRDNGGSIVLSETTAYNSGQYDPQCTGLRTCDQHQIITYLRNCQAVAGCTFVFHSIWGLGWPELPIEWFPPGS